MGKTLWTSANKKWTIKDETEAEIRKRRTDWSDPYSTVAMVSASDGWRIAYASIDVAGRIHIGDYGTTWDYFVPSTVSDRASAQLRKLYKEKKKASGGSRIPFKYAVIVVIRGGSNVKNPAPKLYRTFETAVKHAHEEWKKITPTQKKAGSFVNIGKLSKPVESAKEMDLNRFSYSLMGSITNEYDSFEKKWRYRT